MIFIQILDDKCVSVACVTESWFDTKNGVFSKTLKDAGYKLHHAFREKRGGGVAIVYKNNMTVKDGGASCDRYLSFEYAFVTITLQTKQRMVLVCIYRNQEITFSIFQDELSSFIEQTVFKGDSTVIVGDFNVWVDDEEDQDAKKLLTLMSTYGLNQLVHEPTHRGGHTLDHIYINEFQIQITHEVINDTLGLTTDHFPIVLGIPSTSVQANTRTIHYRKLQDVDMHAFRNDLQQSYEKFDEESNFEQSFAQYRETTSSVVNNHAPVLTKTIKTLQAP